MNGKLQGRVAIITGAGKGIGRAAARLFAEEGASVVVATRSAGPGQEVVEAIEAAGGKALLVPTRLSSRAEVIDVIERTVERFGQIDVIVHNAAYLATSQLVDISDDLIDAMLTVNLKAAIWLAAEGAPYLKHSDTGRLVLTSSITGNRQAHPNQLMYGISKAALNGFIRQAALELAPAGITVNGVEPGLVLTESALNYLSEDALDAFNAAIPRGRAGLPEEIAPALLFLASAESANMTGQTIILDGGTSLGNAFPEGYPR